MSNYQDKVREFQIASGQPVHLQRELTKEELDFRDSLLREEIRELKYAIVDENRAEILDALCDIKYVNDGTANMLSIEQKDKYYHSAYGVGVCSDVDALVDKLASLSCSQVDIINDIVYQLAYLHNFTIDTFTTALIRVHRFGSKETPSPLGKGRNCSRFLLLLIIIVIYFLISEKSCIFGI